MHQRVQRHDPQASVWFFETPRSRDKARARLDVCKVIGEICQGDLDVWIIEGLGSYSAIRVRQSDVVPSTLMAGTEFCGREPRKRLECLVKGAQGSVANAVTHVEDTGFFMAEHFDRPDHAQTAQGLPPGHPHLIIEPPCQRPFRHMRSLGDLRKTHVIANLSESPDAVMKSA